MINVSLSSVLMNFHQYHNVMWVLSDGGKSYNEKWSSVFNQVQSVTSLGRKEKEENGEKEASSLSAIIW